MIIRGQAGPYAAAGMTGGSFEATGDVGDNFGGALPGEMRGMSGGIAILRGNAGQRIGDRMRRGTIIVEGDVGAYRRLAHDRRHDYRTRRQRRRSIPASP